MKHTTIIVRIETLDKLHELKHKLQMRSVDSVIGYLLLVRKKSLNT